MTGHTMLKITYRYHRASGPIYRPININIPVRIYHVNQCTFAIDGIDEPKGNESISPCDSFD